ncbi:MAG: HD domain-containing protein [Planctomycetota bacterium]
MPSIAETVYIADMKPNERFEGCFSISNPQIGKTRNDKPYLRCLLGDKSATVAARMWGADEAVIRRLGDTGFVMAKGETQPYQGELQLIIHDIQGLEPTAEQLADLLPASKRDPKEMFADIEQILGTLEHPAAKALADEYLADEMLMDLFRQAPAAKMMHHAYLGGLCEHTLSLMRVADAIMPMYPKVNRDVVLLGLFLHDLGKTRELSWTGAFDYSERGLMIGHIVDGAIMLHDKAQSAMRRAGIRFPADFVMVLQHIILSHHSLPEHGAARVPSSPEAIMVAMLDNLDAKLAMALAAARPDGEAENDLGGSFTDKVWALDTKLFKPDPLG